MSETTNPTTSRTWMRLALASGAVAVAAVIALVAWMLTRPADSAGAGLAQVRSSASVTPPASSAPNGAPGAAPSAPGILPRPKVRDASITALTDNTTTPPARIVIPDLDVDATVNAVGIQKDGAMVIPAAPTSVGWYRYGSAPSDPAGNTVIAGHVATREDGPGAFAPLKNAEVGMTIKVTDADGTKHSYTITGRQRIVKKTLPVEEIFARSGKPVLILVTCGGEYLPELRSHRDNIVVTATPTG